MKVTREKTENCQAYLTVELEDAEITLATAGAYRRLVNKVNIPGFRKGKAPRDILERYVGKEALLEEGLNQIIPETLDKAMEQEKIEPIARPEVELVKPEPPITYKAVIPLRPVIELGDYKAVRVAKEKIETTDANINAVLDDLRHHHATWEPVERPVQYSDLAVVTINSTVEDKPFFNQDSVQYVVREGSPSPVKGFAEQIIGMKKDEEKEFKLTFAEDYPRPELIGKEVAFKVKVIEVKEEKLPELNDSLAKLVNPEYETMDKLRTYVSENLTKRIEEQSRIEYEDKVVDAIVATSKVEFPPILVDSEIDHMLEDQQRRLQQAGAGGIEEYMRITKKTIEQVRDEMRPSAVKNITRHLVLDKVAEDAKMEPTEEEITAELTQMIDQSGPNREQMAAMLDNHEARHSVEHYLETKKTIDMLVNSAQTPENKPEAEKPVEEKEGKNK